jgi:hypothetical protein
MIISGAWALIIAADSTGLSRWFEPYAKLIISKGVMYGIEVFKGQPE